jgi:hypothetical protein
MDSFCSVRTRLIRDCGVIMISREDTIMLRSVIFQCIAEYRIHILLLNWGIVPKLGAGRVYNSSDERGRIHSLTFRDIPYCSSLDSELSSA